MKKITLLLLNLILLMNVSECLGQRMVNTELIPALKKEFAELKKQLPLEVTQDINVYVLDVDVRDNGEMYYRFGVDSQAYPDYFAQYGKELWSDKAIARNIQSAGLEMIQLFIENGLSLVYDYYDIHSNKKLFQLNIPNWRLEEVKKGMDAGRIKPFTILEFARMEINATKYPIDYGDGIFLTSCYIDDKVIVYQVKIDDDIEKGEMNQEFTDYFKSYMTDAMYQTNKAIYCRSIMSKEGVSMKFVFSNRSGAVIHILHVKAEDFPE